MTTCGVYVRTLRVISLSVHLGEGDEMAGFCECKIQNMNPKNRKIITETNEDE